VRAGHYLRAKRGLRHFAKRVLTRKIRGRPDGRRMRKAEAVGVMCPSFFGQVEGERLEWARLQADGYIDLARSGYAAFNDGWREDPNVEHCRCLGGDIVSNGIIPATLDGEPTTFVSRVRISFQPKGPRVIALQTEES
jgi:hypothetical protein